MTREELIKKLRDLENAPDTETVHIEADGALLAFINDTEITEAFGRIEKWYS